MAGIGVDLVEIARMERITERRGQKFLRRIFTVGEINYSFSRKNAAQHLAARFAAKEALVKARGLPSPWQEIEVSNTPWGKPRFSKLPEGLEPERVQLSLSHAVGMAIAVVVIEP